MPEISVIVPVYNAELYLCRCIDSILSQSFTDFELILIDDGSNDQSGCICDKYALIDKRIQVIHQDNGGASKARNMGLKYVSSKYITFCDSDDYYSSFWLEKLYKAINHYNTDCVVGVRSQKKNKLIKVVNEEQKLDYLVNYVLGNESWEVWARLYRTDIIQLHSIRFCESCEDFAEDLGFSLEYCLYINSSVSVDQKGYNHCTRPDSIMGRNNQTIRFNSVNEVSYSLFCRIKSGDSEAMKHYFPLLHFNILDKQIIRLISFGRIKDLKDQLLPVQRIKWMKKQVIKYIVIAGECRPYFPDEQKWELSLLIAHYLLHENYGILRLERKLKNISI